MKKRNEIRDIKVFATGIGVIFQAIALVSWWRDGEVYPYIAVAGIGFAFTGLSWPRSIKPVYKMWMLLAGAIGRFQSKLLLWLTFYVLITPIAIVFKLLGKDALDLKLEPSTDTYWKEREPERDLTRYEKQF